MPPARRRQLLWIVELAQGLTRMTSLTVTSINTKHLAWSPIGFERDQGKLARAEEESATKGSSIVMPAQSLIGERRRLLARNAPTACSPADGWVPLNRTGRRNGLA